MEIKSKFLFSEFDFIQFLLIKIIFKQFEMFEKFDISENFVKISNISKLQFYNKFFDNWIYQKFMRS